MTNHYINVQGGLGLNLALASFVSTLKEEGDSDKYYICSPYFDVFTACPYIDGVYKPDELKDMILDACNDPDSNIVTSRLYDLDKFIKKQMNYSEAWAYLLGKEWKDDGLGTRATSRLEPLKAYPSLAEVVDNAKLKVKEGGYKDYAIMQFTGGQSPLVQVPPKLDKDGRPIPNEPDWSRVPYDYEHEPLKRHYPMDKAQAFVELYHERNPDTAIIMYQLPNEPCPQGDYIIRTVMPYLAYYELAKEAKEIVCIDSSLQHLTAGLCKTTVIWAHSSPRNFGYSCNNNLIQGGRKDGIFYFTALGPSGARVNYLEPEEILM